MPATSEAYELEARLRNYISGEVTNITKDMLRLGEVNKKVSNEGIAQAKKEAVEYQKVFTGRSQASGKLIQIETSNGKEWVLSVKKSTEEAQSAYRKFLEDHVAGFKSQGIEHQKAVSLSQRLWNAQRSDAEKAAMATKAATASFNEMANEIKGNVIGSLKGFVAGYIGIQGIRKVLGVLKEAHKVNYENNLAVNQLTAGLGRYSPMLVEYANVLERTKMIQTSETLGAAARLSIYFQEESEIKKLLPVVIDLARAKGMTLVSAANMLATSFSRSENAAESTEGSLRGLGIEFTKTGNRAKDLDAMLAAVSSKVKGQTQAVMDSKDGWDRLGFNIGVATEKLGRFLFGISKAEKDLMQYQYALKTIAEGGSYDPETGFVKSTKAQVEALKRIITEYENLHKGLKPFVGPVLPEGTAEFIKKMQKEINDATLAGKREATIKERDDAIAKYGNLVEIHQAYAIKIKAIDKEIADARVAANIKEIEDRQAMIDFGAEVWKKDSDAADRKAQAVANTQGVINKHFQNQATTQENTEVKRQTLIKQTAALNQKIKTTESKYDSDAMKKKVDNAQFALSYATQTMSAIAGGDKKYRGLQKTADVSQSVGNTALAVTKALAPGLQWQIPFIIGLGAAQTARIIAQKYAGGGIVGGNSYSGDKVPAMVNSGEMILNPDQQANLFNTINNNTSSSNVNLTINTGGGNFDQAAVDRLIPMLGPALLKAKREGLLTKYERAR